VESVNAIAWGAADAWIYFSACSDGKVVLKLREIKDFVAMIIEFIQISVCWYAFPQPCFPP
jgi:hypothetical protein